MSTSCGLRRADFPRYTPYAYSQATVDLRKLTEEASYDGIFVLRTNTKINPLLAVLRYRDLLKVEELFRRAKAVRVSNEETAD